MKGEHTPFPAWMARTTKSNFHTLNGVKDGYGVVAIVVTITKSGSSLSGNVRVFYSDFNKCRWTAYYTLPTIIYEYNCPPERTRPEVGEDTKHRYNTVRECESV